MRLLLVEDDDHVAAALSAVLARHGFEVVHARNGEEALQARAARRRTRNRPSESCSSTWACPTRTAIEVCGKIRKLTSTPVIMVTARADVRSRIHGLNLGADDYVTKPYDTGELLARIHAVSRRTASGDEAAAAGPDGRAAPRGTVTIELPTRRVSVDGDDGPADPQGVRPAGAARPAARRRLPPGADHQRGVAHQLGGDRPHPGGARRVPALQAADARPDRDRARRRLPARRARGRVRPVHPGAYPTSPAAHRPHGGRAARARLPARRERGRRRSSSGSSSTGSTTPRASRRSRSSSPNGAGDWTSDARTLQERARPLPRHCTASRPASSSATATPWRARPSGW